MNRCPPGEERANARSTGVWRFRCIVLDDTLIDHLTPDEVAAVAAHEAGHLACRHYARHLSALSVLTFAAAFLAQGLLSNNGFFDPTLPIAGMVLAEVMLLLWTLAPVARLASNTAVRSYEYEADAWAVRRVPAADLAAALQKLQTLNATPMTSDPYYAALHATHPVPRRRLDRFSVRSAATAASTGSPNSSLGPK